jgi:tRNA(fMet)-specific endonuclease VapC
MWLENHPVVRQNIAQHEADLSITIVTVQELFNGWVGRLNEPSQLNQQVKLYSKLSRVVTLLKEIQVIDFDESADQIFRQMLTNSPQLRKARLQRDMRIAAITISQAATIVTRNYRDFAQVPNLPILDWSIDVSS